jgi:hypothetical protein
MRAGDWDTDPCANNQETHQTTDSETHQEAANKSTNEAANKNVWMTSPV